MAYKVFLWDVLNSTMFVIHEKNPSKYLPFKGNLPLVNPGQEMLFRIGCENKTYLEECDDWIQQVFIKAQRIVDIERAFVEFLKDNNLHANYFKMSDEEKADVIQRFFDTGMFDEYDLVIRDSEYGNL